MRHSRPSPRRFVGAPLLALAILLAAALSPTDARAQAGVQGIVTDARTSQPLTGASVVVERGGEAVRSLVTDRNGLYQVDGVDSGAYVLRIAAFGYQPLEEAILLVGGERLTANRGLEASPLQIEGVAVRGGAGGAVQRDLGRQTITARELARVPSPTPGGDMVTYLQTVPGVITTGDRGGQLLIRGGTPSENMVLMDGMLVYQPFHITGFASVFPEELVASAEFFPGGFPAHYSGRISSVLDVRMRDGSQRDRSVSAAISPFLTEVMAEGPVTEGAPFSYIVSARRSLIEETSPFLLGEEQPLRFSSYYMKLSSLGSTGGSRCSLTGMGSNDEGGLDPEDETSRVGWTNVMVGARCTSLTDAVFFDVKFGYSYVSTEAITRGASEFSSSAGRAFLNADVNRTFGRVRMDFGGFASFEDTSYDFLELSAGQHNAGGYTGVGLYAEATLPVGERIRLLPGVTTSWYPQTFQPTLEPRLRGSWQPLGRPDEELSIAAGLYTQPIVGITDRRDAGSVFTAWARKPGDRMMEAIHAQATWQQSLGGGFSWSVDGYYRRMYDLPVTTWSTAATFATEISSADGRAHGADTRLEYRRGPFYGFAGYGYGWTEYEAAQEDFGEWFGEPVLSYHPSHDRRHQGNALASLELGRYSLAARWEYGSGFPFTRPIGFTEVLDFRNELPDVRDEYGDTRVLLDRPYNGRLPSVHRLDVSMRRSFDVGSREIELQAGVINAYGRTNIFYYDVYTNRRLDQLPFAPYASLRLRPGGLTP